MSKLDEIQSSFARKLDEQTSRQEKRLEVDLQALRAALPRQVQPALPQEVARRLENYEAERAARRAAAAAVPALRPAVAARVDLHSIAALDELDMAFTQAFRLADYFPANRLNYPTVYCETLEEFFTPLLNQLKISPDARQAELSRLVREAEEMARQTQGGGMLGVNLPGQGCYLNGWLLAYGTNSSPRAALQVPELLRRILETAAHEKLGHGFLDMYSTLGAVKTQLGLTMIELAGQFGLQAADDPSASLRQQQHNLLFMISQLLEEGWASWIETWLGRGVLKSTSRPSYSISGLVQAIQDLPVDLAERQEIEELMMAALEILFAPQEQPLSNLHRAVLFFEQLHDTNLDTFFAHQLGQPLRYVIGELLLMQVEANLGAACAPYASLIAANIHFDPQQVGLSDLQILLMQDARLHPDARLAALSRLKLERPGDVGELARRAEAQLSFSVPPELKK